MASEVQADLPRDDTRVGCQQPPLLKACMDRQALSTATRVDCMLEA